MRPCARRVQGCGKLLSKDGWKRHVNLVQQEIRKKLSGDSTGKRCREQGLRFRPVAAEIVQVGNCQILVEGSLCIAGNNALEEGKVFVGMKRGRKVTGGGERFFPSDEGFVIAVKQRPSVEAI